MPWLAPIFARRSDERHSGAHRVAAHCDRAAIEGTPEPSRGRLFLQLRPLLLGHDADQSPPLHFRSLDWKRVVGASGSLLCVREARIRAHRQSNRPHAAFQSLSPTLIDKMCRPANIPITRIRSGPSPTSPWRPSTWPRSRQSRSRAKRLAIAGQTFIKTHPSPAAVGKLMRDRLATLGLL
jgi:hypothetical protein